MDITRDTFSNLASLNLYARLLIHTFFFIFFSGVDVIGLLESLNISEKLLTPLKESSAGYFALAFALYKLVTPLRYAVTVGMFRLII